MAITEETITYASTIDPSLTALEAILTYDSAASNRPLLVVLHGFSGVATSFDTNTRARMAKAAYVYLTGVTGTFSASETATAGGATMVVYGVSPTAITGSPTAGTMADGVAISGGTSGATATIDTAILTDVVCLFVELRGRNGTAGDEDAGARELYDIKDAVDWVLANRASRVDSTQIHFAGYSGGGANGLSMAAKFPDLFNSIAVYFPISDYGYYKNEGWYYWGAGSSDLTNLLAWVGGPPTTHRKHYKARMTREAVSNYTGGYLRLFHDTGDTTVPSFHSTNVQNRLDTLGRTNYEISVTSSGDDPRWTHSYPNLSGVPDLTLGEIEYMQEINLKVRDDWTVATSGTLIVPGYIVTKRFEFWCDQGLDDYCTLTYNTTTRVFSIRSTTGGFPWTLKLLGQTPAASVTVTVDGADYVDTVSGAGVAEYSGTHTPASPQAGQVLLADDSAGILS